MKLQDELRRFRACPEAIEWVGTRDLATAWAECERGDWMLWLAGKTDIDRRLLALAACGCAVTALKYVKPGEDSPRKAIVTAVRWARGKATPDEVRTAASSAAAAAYAAYYASSDAAAYAAYYAAAEAAAASSSAAAAYAAYYAAAEAAAAASSAAAAAADAAREAAQREHAAIVRQLIPLDFVRAALERSEEK